MIVKDIADEMIKDINSVHYDKIEVFDPVYSYYPQTYDSPSELWCEPGELLEVLNSIEEVEDFIDNYHNSEVEYYEDGCLVFYEEQ